MKKSVFALLLFTVLFSSCVKLTAVPEGIETNPGSTTSPIVGSWKLTAGTVKVDYGGGLVVDFDIYPSYPVCALDDVMTYHANSVVSNDEGPSKCDNSLPQSQTGKWSLSSDRKKLTIEFPPNLLIQSLTSDVLQLDDKTLKIRYVTYFNGPESTSTVTYTRVK